jgi:hypothetical protein
MLRPPADGDSAWKGAAIHPMQLFGLFPWPRIGWIMNIEPTSTGRSSSGESCNSSAALYRCLTKNKDATMKPFADGDPRPRPFSPPPTTEGIGMSKVVLFVALAIMVIYGLYEWALHQQVSAPTSQPPTPSARTRPPPSPAVTQPSPSAGTGDARIVTKCLINGKTSYGDEACSKGALATQVVTKANDNLVTGLTPSQMAASRRIQGDAPSISGFAATGNAVSANVGECKLIDAEIVRLDALARQPQSGQSQDHISKTRKELRDRQFRVGCR